MTVLGSLTLSDDLLLLGLDSAPPVASSQRRTLSGRSLVQVAPLTGGRSLSLQSENHLSLSEVEAIQAIAATGQPVNLVHHRATIEVLIVGVEMTPAFDHANPESDAWYYGEIFLIEV